MLNVVVRDMAATLDFYRRLGIAVPVDATGTHVQLKTSGGFSLELDTAESARLWHAGWRADPWLRQLDPVVTGEMEDALLRTIARLDGTPFPSTERLASRWLAGRVSARRHQGGGADPETGLLRRCWP
jgi:hypothetical protein